MVHALFYWDEKNSKYTSAYITPLVEGNKDHVNNNNNKNSWLAGKAQTRSKSINMIQILKLES